jgi:phosphomannomutase / phosphoglucomutase
MKPSFDIKSITLPQILLGIAALLFLLAAWLGWAGWQLRAANQLTEEMVTVRRQVADQLQPDLKAALARMAGLKDRKALVLALRSKDTNAAKDIVTQGWTGVEAVEFIAPDLATAYADPAAFGYGKLGVLELASQEGHPALAVVKDAGGPRLALATPVIDDGQALTLVYVRLPVAPLVAKAVNAAPSGGYLALRQGRYNVVESGNVSGDLQFKAEAGAIELGGTAMRVVSAAPIVEGGLMDKGGYGEIGLAGLLALLGVGALLGSRAKSRSVATSVANDGAEAAPPTLGELQSTGQLDQPAASPVVRIAEAPAVPRLALDRSIFRAYDIRGIVGTTLDTQIAMLIGQAVGSLMADRNLRNIVVGRDGRLSSPEMAAALIEGLRKAGRDVIDIGLAPTPVVYFGSFHLRTGCCVSVTGSHNPPDYNGFKIVVDGETLAGDAIQNLYARIAENRLVRSEVAGQSAPRDIKADYIARIAGDVQIERKLRVVVDCGSGVAGDYAQELLEAIGAEVEPLFCEVDGTFPHHHPDPSDPENLVDLIRVVQRIDADIGLAFDGDGDRLGVVTKSGEMIYPDRLLMLFAADVLERNPGACIIYDVKCTGHLATHILRHGGSPLMWKTGHSLIKAKMKETEAELAGEMSGHFFFRERWYGFDDGLYAAARLLEILAATPDDAETVFATLPKGVSTPELKIHVAEGEQYAFIEKFVATAKFEGARLATIDGLRADWSDGWGLVRASNTTPVLVLRFDAKDGAALARIQALFREQMLAVDPDLAIGF